MPFSDTRKRLASSIGILADHQPFRDLHAVVDDDALQLRVAADIDSRAASTASSSVE